MGSVAAKRAVNLSLNRDLVDQARAYTSNLSATLEQLLGDYVARERARRHERDAAIESVIDFMNEFHSKHGLLSDEFQNF